MDTIDRTKQIIPTEDRETLDKFVERCLKYAERFGIGTVPLESVTCAPGHYYSLAAEGCQLAIQAEGIHMSGSALAVYANLRNYAESKANACTPASK